jgi:hypothetical protein
MTSLKRMLGGASIFFIACLVLPTGCGKKDDKKGTTTAGGTTTGGATTTGTAGGNKKERDYTLFAPKNSKTHDYHIRLKVDTPSKTAHATVYDSEDAEKKAIDGDTITINIPGEKTPIELKCAEGEKGKCIHFMGKDDRLGAPIDLAKVELKATIAGKQRLFELDKDD